MKVRVIKLLRPLAERQIGEVMDVDWGIASIFIQRGIAELVNPEDDPTFKIGLTDNKKLKKAKVKAA